MALQDYSKKSKIVPKVERHAAGTWVIVGMIFAYILLMAMFAHSMSPALADFIVNNLEINEYYVGRLLLFTFLGFSMLLVLVLIMLDGEDKRLQSMVYKYTSFLAEDAKKRVLDPEEEAQSKLVAGEGAGGQMTREAASIRPEAKNIEEDYEQGRMDGTFKEFWPDGEKLKREIRYISGKRDGLFRTYYENGNVEQEGLYRDDQLDGIYRSFYESGAKHQEREYLNGKLHGLYKALDEQGVPFFEINYKYGKQHGEDRIYDHGGVMQYLDTYVSGIRVNRKTYNEYGALKYDQDFEEGIEELAKMEAEERIREREEKLRQIRIEKGVQEDIQEDIQEESPPV